MYDIIIENAVSVAATLLMTLIGIAGAWLTAKLAKREELASINAAQQEVIAMTQQTVGELQQTVVDDLKAASADRKLAKEEIASLGEKLLNKTQKKISAAAITILEAASVDIKALITGAAEDWLISLKIV